MTESYIILLIILILGLIVKNTSLTVAVGILLVLKILRLNQILRYMDHKGIQLGLIILMVGLLAPVALGEFGLEKFTGFFKSPLAILALGVGLFVTIFARQGVQMMANNPIVIATTILGILIGVIFFKGVPVGPLVASGLTAAIYGLIKFFIR